MISAIDISDIAKIPFLGIEIRLLDILNSTLRYPELLFYTILDIQWDNFRYPGH
jgi:hypothetical protein